MFVCPRLAQKVHEHLPCIRNIARDRAYQANAEIERALVWKVWEHNQAQHRERDTSTRHILGPVVNGCTSCRLWGRQNGVGKLSEFVLQRCTSRDQELRHEVMCWIPREPHPGGPRDKWQQRSLKSFFVPSVDTVSDDVVGNPAVPCEVFSSSDTNRRWRQLPLSAFVAAPSTTFFSRVFGQRKRNICNSNVRICGVKIKRTQPLRNDFSSRQAVYASASSYWYKRDTCPCH